ncbi:oligosaccharide biosynthesis protein Alg14 like-domain-containing protein [Mrakia frigida]|uniref:N-acetylglucosaminyldiphosphodolichol N-acetylglucosaminyltransferase anchoring subunit ALG14 n=1 Tax=Mrakia frigida TaxID=29902 RepID=UPI003FCC061D
MLPLFLLFFLLTPPLALYRLWSIRPNNGPHPATRKRKEGETCSLAVFLGSGGHTYESLALISTLPLERYTPRLYIYSEGDEMSRRKAVELETKIAASASSSAAEKLPYRLKTIPRARRVGQPMLSSVVSTLYTLLHTLFSFLTLTQPFADVLILNGPASSVCLVATVVVGRFLGFPTPKVIYVESFARTRRASVSGAIVRGWVDRFLVQWEGLLDEGKKRGEFVGVVV